MANAFTVARANRFGGHAGKSFLLVEGALVIDTTATGGAAAGDLPASMFSAQAQKVVSAEIVLSDDSKVYTGTPSYAGTSLLVVGGAANVPMDLPNGTYQAKVILY